MLWMGRHLVFSRTRVLSINVRRADNLFGDRELCSDGVELVHLGSGALGAVVGRTHLVRRHFLRTWLKERTHSVFHASSYTCAHHI